VATETETVQQIREEYKYGFSNPDEAKDYFFKSGRGISHEVVEAIAEHKNEPDWMRKFRHKSLDYFLARPLPQWGGNLNDGFSGGEKKRVEILQMAMLEPKIAVLDETDSGLDIDALKVVAEGVQQLVGPKMGALVITHYNRILKYIQPDFVHVFVGGKIVEEGGAELAEKLEASGYVEWEGRVAA